VNEGLDLAKANKKPVSKIWFSCLAFILIFTLGAFRSHGQTDDLAPPSDVPANEPSTPRTVTDDIEALFSAEEADSKPVSAGDVSGEEASRPSAPKGADASEQKPSAGSEASNVEVRGLSDLVRLSPFDDVAVIQRRFLPKTKRFELFGGVSGVINDAFFFGIGPNGRIGYYFQEKYGVELLALFLSSGEKRVTEDLRKNRAVRTQTLVSAENFFGIDFKWIPMYGKMSYRNSRITPFDLYFSFGLGLTGTNQGENAPTLHLGTGQVFARTKSAAYRWDLSWNVFSAKSNLTGGQQASMYNTLLLTLGMSFFFPEATYR